MPGTLVVHPGALGDVLLAIPALRALRRAHPHDPLTLAAQPRIGEVLHALRVVDAAVDFDSLGLDVLFTDESPAGRVRSVAEATRVVCWFGAKDPDFARRLRAVAHDSIVASPAVRERLVWEHLLGTVDAATHSIDAAAHSDDMQLRGPAPLSASLLDEGRRALVAAGWDGRQPLVMVHPGAGGAGKRWPAEGFVDVITAFVKAHAAGIVLHEGPADHDAVRALRGRFREPLLSLDNPRLPVLAGALGQVALYFGNDSGVSHLAASVGARSVILFTTETLPWRPWSATAECVVVTTSELTARDVKSALTVLERVWARS